MAIVNRNTPEAEAPEFAPGGDDYLKDYIADIQRPKQYYDQPEIEDDSDFEELENLEEQREPSKYAQKRGHKTAQFAVSTVDKIISSLVAVYAHSDNVEDFQADESDIEDLAEQWGVYFTESNLDLPPWVFAIITTGFVLMKKFKAAGSMRKVNIELRKFKDENESLKIQFDMLTQKNKVLELRKKVEEMEKTEV